MHEQRLMMLGRLLEELRTIQRQHGEKIRKIEEEIRQLGGATS